MSDTTPPRALRGQNSRPRSRGRPHEAPRPERLRRRPQGSFRLAPALNDFYKHDPRRARSRERDLGLRWRARDDSTYRAAWIADTGELYSVRHGNHADEARVTVLGRLDGGTLERALHGWREVCDSDEPGTYEWLQERARGFGMTRPDVVEPAPAAA
jgi:hypothetical protein